MRGTVVRIGVTGAGALLALGLLVAQPAGASGSGRDGKSTRTGKSQATACFDTSGKTQGRSFSDPDGMSNGGPDKPGCSGGSGVDQDGNNGCGNDADREDDNNGRCRGRNAQREQKVKAARAERENTDRAKAAEVEADRKTRCERHNGASKSVTTTTAGPNVSAAGSSNACSCPKTPDTGITAQSVAGLNVQAAAASAKEALSANAALSATETSSTTVAALSSAGSTTPAAVEATTATAPQTEVLGETLERPSALARTGAGVGVLALVGGLLCGSGRLALLARRFLRID